MQQIIFVFFFKSNFSQHWFHLSSPVPPLQLILVSPFLSQLVWAASHCHHLLSLSWCGATVPSGGPSRPLCPSSSAARPRPCSSWWSNNSTSNSWRNTNSSSNSSSSNSTSSTRYFYMHVCVTASACLWMCVLVFVHLSIYMSPLCLASVNLACQYSKRGMNQPAVGKSPASLVCLCACISPSPWQLHSGGICLHIWPHRKCDTVLFGVWVSVGVCVIGEEEAS